MNCKVMGIVNVTPDSFSDGGQYFKPEEAVRRARNLVADGADIIDLGGESTRPGATPLPWSDEWARLEPVLRGLSPETLGTVPRNQRGQSPVLISVDTYHPETAERAIAAGAQIINCVSPGTVPAMMEICAQKDAELVIPCRLTGPVPGEIGGPVPLDRLYLDPMIGFGTTRDEDLELLRSVPELAKRGRVLIGASRKRIVRKLVCDPDSSESRKMGNAVGKLLGGSVGIAVWCAMNGASVVRVHDVKETVQALKVVAALNG